MTTALLVLTALVAVADWAAVARTMRRIERVAKPLTLALLVAAACSADLGPLRPWLVIALAFSLLGDGALLFATTTAVPTPGPAPLDTAPASAGPDPWFLLGLGCFLLGHIAYLVAFTRHGVHLPAVVVGAVVVGASAALTVPTVVRAAVRADGRLLATIVAGYAGLLGAMVVLGIGTASVATAIGAVLFLVSDTTLAWGRFVRPLPRGPVAVIITYHLAQLLIVIGLLR